MKLGKNQCKKRRLGKTNLMVSEIGLGCRSLGGEVTINGLETNVETVSSL